MGMEIEAKMKLHDRDALRRQLESLGAKQVAQLFEVNRFFDTPDRALRAQDKGLRIRTERKLRGKRQQITVTFKGPRAHSDIKARREIELQVQDEAAAGLLLQSLGMEPVLSFEKKRERWQLDDCRVELDDLPLLGDFVEIEGPGEDQVRAVRQKLAMQDQPLIQSSYASMIAQTLAERNLPEPHLSFDTARRIQRSGP